MHEIVNGLIIVAVIVLVIVRRFTRRRVDEGRFFVIPVVVGIIGITQGGAIDGHHVALSTGLLAAEIVAALLMGLGLGASMHVWRDADGSHWSRGTWVTFGVFLASIAVRGGLMLAGSAAGVKPAEGTVLISVAVWLLAQNAVLVWRARSLPGRVSVYP
jgi:hypothetical protein